MISFILILTNALIAPSYAANESQAKAPAGFKMTQIVSGGVYEKIGLKPDDTILTFNGQPVREAKDLEALSQTIARAKTLDLVVLRQGKIEKLHLNLK